MEKLAWLDACYVQNILRNAEEDESIEVSNITVKAATKTGDNYGSDMHRVFVDLSRDQDGHRIQEKKSLIAKVAPQGDFREEMMEAIGFFDTELSMMSVTLPRMTEILENVCPTSFSAKCFHVQYEMPSHVVMEDLEPKGFRMADRHAGMDLEHCVLTIRNIGIFHAVSIALKEQDPKSFIKYKRGMFHKDQHAVMVEAVAKGVKAFTKETPNWSELSPRIAEKLIKLSEVFWEKACEAVLYQEDDFNVLNHGDCWINNMLFRYDEQQKPIEHTFVDFQISNYGSPAVDILYFFGTSPTNEVRLHHREALLQEYHASLSSTMAKLKCNTEVPSFDKLQEILRKRAFCEVVATMTVLPIVALEKGEVIDMKELVDGNGEYVNPAYHGKSYMKIMTELLPWFDSNGFLDV